MTRKSQAGVLHGSLDAFPAFLHGRIGETNDGEGRKPACGVHFDLDDRPLKANDGARVDLGEHVSSLDGMASGVKWPPVPVRGSRVCRLTRPAAAVGLGPAVGIRPWD